MGTVRFVLDGAIQEVAVTDPTATLLDHLRYKLGRTGTKEGCSEGDCGACTVLVGTLNGDGLIDWRAVNACILFLPMLDGRALLTVESLATDGALHPVQQAMVDHHGSQCGFCTPGFVMSLYARSIEACGTKDQPVGDVIAGNLCRCTGYGPILDAGNAVPVSARDDGDTIALLQGLRREQPLTIHSHDPETGVDRHWLTPRSIEQLADMLVAHPTARVIAGGTDIGLWVTKKLDRPEALIWIGDVAELNTIREDRNNLVIGAGVRYSDAHAALARLHPDLGELVRRIGGLQVRNAGTIGGNIANGSPIGDMPPALIALGAELTLRHGDRHRTMPLEDFFITYGKQDRVPGEFVDSVRIPRPDPNSRIAITKLSKRFDSDISAVCAAISLHFDGDVVRDARLAFGGMAGIPARAEKAEAVLCGKPFDQAAVDAAIAALGEDFAPLSDLRGSSAYRLQAAGNLLRRLLLQHEGSGEPVSVLDPRLVEVAG